MDPGPRVGNMESQLLDHQGNSELMALYPWSDWWEKIQNSSIGLKKFFFWILLGGGLFGYFLWNKKSSWRVGSYQKLGRQFVPQFQTFWVKIPFLREILHSAYGLSPTCSQISLAPGCKSPFSLQIVLPPEKSLVKEEVRNWCDQGPKLYTECQISFLDSPVVPNHVYFTKSPN